MIRKRIYLTAAISLLVVSFSAYYLYRVNRSARSRLEYANRLIEVNPRKALADVEQINRTFLSERNYMMCDLVKAGALIGIQEYLVPDSLLISAVSSPKNPALTRITLWERALTPTFAPLL